MLANLVSVIIEILDFEGGILIKMLKSIMSVGNILADIFLASKKFKYLNCYYSIGDICPLW